MKPIKSSQLINYARKKKKTHTHTLNKNPFEITPQII